MSVPWGRLGLGTDRQFLNRRARRRRERSERRSAQSSALVFETLEPRLLLNADPFAAGQTLTGGPGAQTFVFDAAALADAQATPPVIDTVADYNQTNSGSYDPGEGDRVDWEG